MGTMSHSFITNLFAKGCTSPKDKRQRVGKLYTIPNEETRVLLGQLIFEECMETLDSLGLRLEDGNVISDCAGSTNLMQAIDGCCDLKFVCDGALAAMGVPDLPHMDEVCRANREKFPKGKVIINKDTGKYLKPEDWQGPRHELVKETVLQALAGMPSKNNYFINLSKNLVKDAKNETGK